MRRIIYFGLIVFSFVSCSDKNDDLPNMIPNFNSSTFNDEGDYNYLALGDSYTIGQGVSANETFPVQLARELISEGFDLTTPEIIAQTGWTTSNLISAISNTSFTQTYDLITLLIGVNNQYGGGSTEQFRTQFEDLLLVCIKLAGGENRRVVVLSIPDYSVTPFASSLNRSQIANEIDSFNRLIKEEVERKGVYFIDVTEISRKALNNMTLLSEDSLHPSPSMYKEWVEIMLPAAVQAIQNKKSLLGYFSKESEKLNFP